MHFIDLKTQYGRVRVPLNARIQAVLEHGQYVLGAETIELEQSWPSSWVRSTASLRRATDALPDRADGVGIGAGDEVITSPFTFIATGEMIALAGAKPVFVDIDARTYNIEPAMIEQAITPRTNDHACLALRPMCGFGRD